MKTLKNFILLALLFAAVQVSAQTDKPTTARIIDAQNYVFVATSAYPLNAADISRILNRLPGSNGSGTIDLTGSSYDLTVTKDSIVAYLPYYGRSYTPRMGGGPDDTGIKFKSKDFTYNSVKRKKGGWIINIKTKDLKDNYSLSLNLTETGYASLTANTNIQQSITFNGYLAEPKPKKEAKSSPEATK